MNTALALLRLLRLPNLVIVFLSQFLPYYFLIRPAIVEGGCVPVLSPLTFSLLCGNTVLTTLAGYLINDVKDASIDAINKPSKVVIGRFISARNASLFYIFLIGTILCIAYFLGNKYGIGSGFWAIAVFGGVSAALYLYAVVLKCTPLLGNLWVALLCAVVPLVVSQPEDRPLVILSNQSPELYQHVQSTLWMYVFFAFGATLFREMVKDLEDFSGDSACSCRTLPVIKGISYSKKWTILVGAVILFALLWLIFSWIERAMPVWKITAGILLLIFPLVFALVALIKGNSKKDFHNASTAIKILMLSGLVLLTI